MTFSTDTKLAIKTSLFTAVVTVILLLLVNYTLNHTWNPLSNNQSKSPPITVEGTGTVTAEPDQSSVYFSITKTAKTLQDAQDKANTVTDSIVSDLQKVGVAKKDIQTSNYNSSPNYDDTATQPNVMTMPIREPQSQLIISYTVSENVSITIYKTSMTSKIIDTATKDGAENISGPNLTFSDTKQQDLENEARAQAVKNARQKAQSIATAAGIHLGKLTKIEDNQSTPYPVIRPLMMNAARGVAKSTPTEISTGQNSVTTSVTISYETY